MKERRAEELKELADFVKYWRKEEMQQQFLDPTWNILWCPALLNNKTSR